MEPTIKPKVSVKDFFLNLGAIVALYTVVVSLINLLFTVINTAYPQIVNDYYQSSGTISWSVATLIIFFPIFILLMWLLEAQYKVEPERKSAGIHKWLTYITLFISGLAIAGDLITVLYYFIDGQELTTGFLLKVAVLLVVVGGIFIYYITDLRDKLTSNSRMIWRVVSAIVIIGSIVWGFSVLGSPRTQRLIKYDEQKVNDLMNITYAVQTHYSTNGVLPKDFVELAKLNYSLMTIDSQTQKVYEYSVTDKTHYELCADFNKATSDNNNRNNITLPTGSVSWSHPAGRYCFPQTVVPNNSMYAPIVKPL